MRGSRSKCTPASLIKRSIGFVRTCFVTIYAPRLLPRMFVLCSPSSESPRCYDFVHDTCANGTKLKVLTIEDELTRESLTIKVGRSLPAGQVVAVLAQLFTARGAPANLRSDNGPEFVAQQVKRYLAQEQVRTQYIEPGKPWQNGVAESFHGKFRDECLSREWFINLADARRVVAQYQRYYNEERPHSSLGYLTPVEFRQAYEAHHQARKANP